MRQAPSSPLKADELLAQVAPDRAQKRAEHTAAQERRRAEYRTRFPLAAELMDVFRSADASLPPNQAPLSARPVFASNAVGETWGAERDVGGIAVDGDKMAHLPAFEASWRKFYGKHADSRQAYNERAQRAIKPGKGIE